MSNNESVREVEVKCMCGRKVKVKFLSPVVVEQTAKYETRFENSDGK